MTDTLKQEIARALHAHEWEGQPEPDNFETDRDYWMAAATAALRSTTPASDVVEAENYASEFVKGEAPADVSRAAVDEDALVERLRDESEALQRAAWSRPDGGADACIAANLATEAADRIQSLQESIQSLQERIRVKDEALRYARPIIQSERDVLVECHSSPPDKNATDFDPAINDDVAAMDIALAAIDEAMSDQPIGGE